jgi:hypothetical protein
MFDIVHCVKLNRNYVARGNEISISVSVCPDPFNIEKFLKCFETFDTKINGQKKIKIRCNTRVLNLNWMYNNNKAKCWTIETLPVIIS